MGAFSRDNADAGSSFNSFRWGYQEKAIHVHVQTSLSVLLSAVMELFPVGWLSQSMALKDSSNVFTMVRLILSKPVNGIIEDSDTASGTSNDTL